MRCRSKGAQGPNWACGDSANQKVPFVGLRDDRASGNDRSVAKMDARQDGRAKPNPAVRTDADRLILDILAVVIKIVVHRYQRHTWANPCVLTNHDPVASVEIAPRRHSGVPCAPLDPLGEAHVRRWMTWPGHMCVTPQDSLPEGVARQRDNRERVVSVRRSRE